MNSLHPVENTTPHARLSYHISPIGAHNHCIRDIPLPSCRSGYPGYPPPNTHLTVTVADTHVLLPSIDTTPNNYVVPHKIMPAQHGLGVHRRPPPLPTHSTVAESPSDPSQRSRCVPADAEYNAVAVAFWGEDVD